GVPLEPERRSHTRAVAGLRFERVGGRAGCTRPRSPQGKGHFDDHAHADRFAFESTGRETPFPRGFECFLIQPELWVEWAMDLTVGRLPVCAHDTLDQGNALDPCAHGVGRVVRSDLA